MRSAQQRGGVARRAVGALLCFLASYTMADAAAPVRRLTFPAVQQAPHGVIATPFQFHVTGEDNLEITTFNSVAGVRVDVHVRFLDDSDVVSKAYAIHHTPNTDRTAATTRHALGAGALLNLRAVAGAGSPLVGQTFVIVRVVRGMTANAIALGTLVQGYVTGNQDLAYPGSPLVGSTDVEPPVRFVIGTDPPAGTQSTETVPSGARWEVVMYTIALNTSAVAATRRLSLHINTVAEFLGQFTPSATQAASLRYVYTFGQGLSSEGAVKSAFVNYPLATSLILSAGARLITSIENLDAGDNLEAPKMHIREWLEAQ